MAETGLFSPSRAAGLDRLEAFAPAAGRAYAAGRNTDPGPDAAQSVSRLSPWIRHRALTEPEVLHAVLTTHPARAAEKFVQEVYWRTYFKGWLEMRPSVWTAYRAELRRALDDVATQAGLRASWESACRGETGIACFDAWARELAETGYLHNHARMWFASIWVFTLRLPWVLGADFFLRHLLDGDPASNTLSWRWVAGLQTRGKNYLARPDNIARHTNGRFHPAPGELATQAPPLDGPPHPPRMDPPAGDAPDASRPAVLLLHMDDLSPGFILETGMRPIATAVLAPQPLSPLEMAPRVCRFREALMSDCLSRWEEPLGPVEQVSDPVTLTDWARTQGAAQIVTPYAPVGPVAEWLDGVTGLPVARVMRQHDRKAWPNATAGFFKFKDRIPRLISDLEAARAA